MPELPEVETIVRSLQSVLVGRRIAAVQLRWPRQAEPDAATVVAQLVGRTVLRLTRRAKLLVATLDDGSGLLVHLRMSGRFAWSRDADQAEEPRHVRAVLALDGFGKLMFCDARKFGRLRWTADPEAALRHLGPEPLGRSFTAAWLAARLASRRRRLKPLLLDQRFVSGLGNIYTDESLHRARLHPTTRSDRVSRAGARRLHRAIRQVLREGILHCGTSLDWIYPGGRMQNYLRVYGRGGQPCGRCGGGIERVVVAQRSTWLCPRCQPLLATPDRPAAVTSSPGRRP